MIAPARKLMLTWALAATAAGQPTSVLDSPHNLSASGPGAIRAAMEDQVCIFCHAPHNASPVKPLWNRAMPVDSYSIYTSRALDAVPGQPTGVSKMCLSCHDGTIAIGNILSQNTPILMIGGVTTMPAGPGHIGTDLRDDHPISFRYDSSLVAKDAKLRFPSSLPSELKLDRNAELQCTTCHDAHNNSLGKFLVKRNTNSELCVSCHQVGTTTVTGHNNCSACHQPHSAPSGPYLLRRQTVSETCLSCHDGSVTGAANIANDMKKVSVHDTASPVDPPGSAMQHAVCTSCHDPHTMDLGRGTPQAAHPNFGKVKGVNASGSPVARVTYEFEACFRCHADGNQGTPIVSRRIVQNNTRLEFSQNAVSYHPVETPGRNLNVPSLRPPLTTSSVIMCSTCHASENSGLPGGGARGTHGSNFSPVLTERYDMQDFTSESSSAYALCYRCHDRTNILSDASFPGHKQHIVDLRTPCAACHDSHGIASVQGTPTGNSNLINFASNIVFPDPQTGRLEFRDTGLYSGECFLTCHGRNHSPERYPGTAARSSARGIRQSPHVKPVR